jgi:hypothetical protein
MSVITVGLYTPIVYALGSWYRWSPTTGHWERVKDDAWKHMGER